MAERIGIYPGTFDPITKGHLHIIQRASRLVDRLIVGVAGNQRKSPLFSTEERLEMVRHDIGNLFDKGCDIEVESFDDLLSFLCSLKKVRLACFVDCGRCPTLNLNSR